MTLQQEIEEYNSRLSRTLCGKLRLPTEAAALRALQSCRRAGRNEKRTYRCKACGGWHLTSKERLP